MVIIKAVITTLDNLPLLKEQARILRADPLVSEIVVVSNGSKDGTNEWLVGQDDLVSVVRENRGAGPGRNAGLNAAGEFDYVVMLDGGIRPLVGGTRHMLDYLEAHPEADVIGVEVADVGHGFETDPELAWRRWPVPIEVAYPNTRLSHTAYCLCRARAWDGLRFSEEGPFGEPGWGCDDDEMACRWNEAGVVVHVVRDIHPYRRASGSFRRLYQETGVWPNQYGSVYEKRLVWLQQNWPQYQQGIQWGEPWLTVVVRATDLETTARAIKRAHERLRERKFNPPWGHIPNPYSVVLWQPSSITSNTAESAKERWTALEKFCRERCLRQHHGDAYVSEEGEIVRRGPENEELWAGDFRMWRGLNWLEAVRPNSYHYGLVSDATEIDELVDIYNATYPPQGANNPPTVLREEIEWSEAASPAST